MDKYAIRLSSHDLNRFASHVGSPTPAGCRLWNGASAKGGYGAFNLRRRTEGIHFVYPAHRVAWYVEHGAWPDPDLVLDHECHNRAPACKGGPLCHHRRCVEPSHLFLRTIAENTLRGKGHGTETHCPSGHKYTQDNTYIWGRRKMRTCRTCHRERQRLYRSWNAAL